MAGDRRDGVSTGRESAGRLTSRTIKLMIKARNAATGPKRTPSIPAYQMKRAVGRMRKRRTIHPPNVNANHSATSVADDNSIDQPRAEVDQMSWPEALFAHLIRGKVYTWLSILKRVFSLYWLFFRKRMHSRRVCTEAAGRLLW